MSTRRDLAALKSRLQRKARKVPARQVVSGSGNLVAGRDVVIIHRDVKPDNRSDGPDPREVGASIDRPNPPPSPVATDASTWARFGYLVRLLLWRAAERLRGTDLGAGG